MLLLLSLNCHKIYCNYCCFNRTLIISLILFLQQKWAAFCFAPTFTISSLQLNPFQWNKWLFNTLICWICTRFCNNWSSWKHTFTQWTEMHCNRTADALKTPLIIFYKSLLSFLHQIWAALTLRIHSGLVRILPKTLITNERGKKSTQKWTPL